MIFIGAGYIGLEYAHFFSAFGTKVSLINRFSTLLPFEEPEISHLLKQEMGKRVVLHLGMQTSEVRHDASG
jgi:pyruvate/2-oxoglutarate dehydrogenase complex dihydrolipoamide dehydrogenase (E3) component